MKTVFDKINRGELIERIQSLNIDARAQWGSMTLYQMLKHCTLADEMYLGKKKYARIFMGRILGKMALKNILKDEAPMMLNARTLSDFIVTGNGDASAQRTEWIATIESYADFSGTGIVHWFFGKMSKEQIGQFAYKHTDHHLRQFNN